MQLRTIDKSLYQKRFKRVAIGLAVSLAVLGLLFSTVLIALFGGETGSNTALNATGVLMGLAVLVAILQQLKLHPYFTEVAYVWYLKQELNLISRRLKNIKEAAQQGNPQAMIILDFSYQGSKQLWQLDDNTLVMEELALWQAELDALQQCFNTHVSHQDYQRDFLKDF